MKFNLLAFAVPIAVAFILIEYQIGKRRNKDLFQLNEAVANLNVGIAERITDLFVGGLFITLYHQIQIHFGFFEIKANIWTWIVLVLITDFIWYWYHRFGHEVSLFWGVHVVHHQSEDFNFTVSTRITVFQAAVRGVFWCILPLIGFPAPMILVMLLIHGAYPFFTHTQLIGKLGWIEYIFVTPSHHRVHHSSNAIYMDKNYGDIFIFWDKIFGTYAAETEQPVYGLGTPLKSYSFLWQHFHFLLELGMAIKYSKGWKNKWLLIWGKPDQIDKRFRPILEKKLLQQNRGVSCKPHVNTFVMIQTVTTLLILFLLLLLEFQLTTSQLILSALFILICVINTGAILEKRSWVFHLEFARLAALSIFMYSITENAQIGLLLIAAFIILILFYQDAEERYLKLIYQH
ncbi:MAG: hypothetical protein RLY16_2730 [Bacteroidota bacterium]|jgi:sterol desaturase/sphingolipid hydroxylase (fatty acid hydroxylase superfamily)